MKKFLLPIITFFLATTTFFAQKNNCYSPKINGQDFVSLTNAKQLNFKNNEPHFIKLEIPIVFDGSKKENLYISNEGWLSFDANTSLKAMLGDGEITSFITPLTLFKNGEATESYQVSLSYETIEKEQCIIVQWKNSDIAFQSYLFRSGEIEFRYNYNTSTYEEKIANKENVICGVVRNKDAVGIFPFGIKDKDVNQIETDFLKENNSLSFSKANKIIVNNDDKSRNSRANTADNYSFSTSTTTYTTVSGTNLNDVEADDATQTANIGFTFNYCGTDYTQVLMSSNGWIAFNTGISSSQTINDLDGSSSSPEDRLAPLWDDLDGNGHGARCNTSGSSPNRTFEIEWRNWEWNYSANSNVITFKVVLHEGSNQIDFVYRQESGSVNSGSASVGIQDAIGNFQSLNNTGSSPTPSSVSETTSLSSKPATGQVYTFTPPVACSGTPTAGTISSDISDFCTSGTPTLTASGYSADLGITFQWQSSPDNSAWSDISGATSNTYTASPAITQTTYYRLHVTCTNSGNTSTTNTVTVTNTSESITGTNTPVNIACSNTATLTATSTGGTIHWWDVATGGTSVGSGGSYTTPVINGNTTYYVSTGDAGSTGNVGKAAWDSGAGYFGTTNWGIRFDAISDFTLVSVDVYVETAGSPVSIQLQDNTGAEITTVDFASCPSGLNTLTLNINIATGTDYRLVSNNSTNLGRDGVSLAFPYTLAGVCSLTASEWGGTTTATYYFFYNWVVSSGCESARTPVNIVVTSGTSAPDCSNLTSPVDGESGLVVDEVTLNWDASLTGCQQATSYKLYFGTDNPPTNIVNGTDIGNVLTYDPGTLTAPQTYYWKIVPTNADGDASGCSIYSFSTEPTITIGTGTTTTAISPYRNYRNAKIQYIYTAAELTAAGLPAGATITTASFNVSSKSTGAAYVFNGFNLQIANTSASDYSGGATWLTPSWTTLYSNNYTTVNGWNTHGTGSLVWDGVSNIVVQACYDNPDYDGTDDVYYTTTDSDYRTCYAENDTEADNGCTLSAETRTYNRANIRFNYILPIFGENTITTGGGTEATTVPSTIDTQGGAILNFDFTVNDDGTNLSTDNDPTLIKQIIFKQGTGNDVADWSTAIAGAVLLDDAGHSTTANVTINANTIVFSNIDNGNNKIGRINDNASKTYTLKVWLNCPLSGINEGDNFVFEVDNFSFLVETSGSSAFKDGENENSGATNNALTIDATKFQFVTNEPPTQVPLGVDFTVTINATDECGNVDTDYTGAVTLTNSGTGAIISGVGLSQNFVAGTYTWTDIQYDVAEIFTITASDGTLPAETSWNINCVPEIIIGDGTSTSSSVTPYRGLYRNGRIQYIYTKDELLAKGLLPNTTITAAAFNVEEKNSTAPYSNFYLRIGHTADNDFASAAWKTPTWTTMYNGNYTTALGWNTHSGTNFTWNGTDNIIVQACFDNANYSSSDDVYYTSTPGNTVCYAENDTEADNGCTLAAETTSSSRANIKFTYIPLIGESDIIAAGSEVSNIDYSLYQDAAINTTTDGIKVWSFTLRDGGGSNDSDTDPTDLSQLTITKGNGNTVTSWANTIRQAAIFDGAVKVGEISVIGEELVFSGLTGLRANDNSSNTFDLYISFETTVTDNEQFEFEIQKRNQYYYNQPSSYFKNFIATSSSANDDNRIVIVATDIAFTKQPDDRQVDYEMFPMPKVVAVDALGNVDIDFNGTISLSSTGTMLNAPISYTLTDGEVICNGVIHTVVQTNRTLTASTGTWSATSTQFDIFANPCVITTSPAHTDGELYICLGTEIDFSASLSGSGTISSYLWEMGDGNEETTPNVNDYLYDDAAGYYVRLSMDYNDGTNKTCATDVRIMISDGPTINSVTQDIQSCYGGTYELTASGSGSSVDVTGYSGTGAVTLSLADKTHLPDIESGGSTAIYSSVLTYTQFDPASTLTDEDQVTVYANIEHSYWGDLEIWLECPNGQTAWLTDGYGDSGTARTFLGEPVDNDIAIEGNGMEYRWTMVSPSYPSMDDVADGTAYTESYVDNGGTTVTDHEYFPEGTYYPLQSFTNFVGCPLNGDWTIYVKDHLHLDDGYIFEWGLELDESLMPGQWEYTFDIDSYDWTGAGAPTYHPTGSTATVTPPDLGVNTYTLTVTDDHGCETVQTVDITQSICDETWTGAIDSNWDDTGNWNNGIIPICLGGEVIIPDVTNDPIISGTSSAYNLTVETGANLTIAPSGALTVCGTLTNTPGTSGLILKSDATGTGSLIHNTTGVNATVETYIEGLQYHYISSPISNATVANAGIQGGVNGIQFYLWDSSMEWFGMGADPYGTPSTIDYNPWVNVSSGNLDVGKGYAYFYETQTLNFQGTLNVEDLPALSCGHASITTGSEADQGWNFFGNPYPSSLDWDVISGNISDGLEKTLYMFNDADGTGAQANYVYYVPSGGSVPSIGSAITSKFVPPGQGFFVRAPSNTDILQINANARIHGTTTFFKEEQTENVLRFIIEDNQAKYDEMVLRLVDVASNSFDGDYDARKLKPSNSSIPIIYSFTDDNTEVAINSLSSSMENLIVPVGFIGQAGNYVIKTNSQTLEIGREVYLVDKYENKTINMFLGTEYSFNHNGGVDNNRFELHFNDNANYINSDKEQIVIMPNPCDGRFSILLNYKNVNIRYKISIVDELGKILFKQNGNSNIININKFGLSSGIYFINIETEDKPTVFKKLIIK